MLNLYQYAKLFRRKKQWMKSREMVLLSVKSGIFVVNIE